MQSISSQKEESWSSVFLNTLDGLTTQVAQTRTILRESFDPDDPDSTEKWDLCFAIDHLIDSIGEVQSMLIDCFDKGILK